MSKTVAPLFLRCVTPFWRTRPVTKLSPAPRVTFILSTGRTGTKYVADLLNQLDDVVAVHEPVPSRVLQAWTSAFLEGNVSDDAMRTVLYNKRRKALGTLQTGLYVESNHFIDGFVEQLDAVFENPTVIHIVRDPRDFVTSMINRGNDRGWKLLVNKYVPYFAYAPAGVKRSRMSAIERETYHWLGMNQVLSDYGASHPKNYHRFTFEDVFSKPEVFTKLLTVAGVSAKQIKQLDLDAPSKNASRHADMPAWQQWPAADRKFVEQTCGDLMRLYGYTI